MGHGDLNEGGKCVGGGGEKWSVFRHFLRMSKYHLACTDWRTSKFQSVYVLIY